jgi:hypothetical protein
VIYFSTDGVHLVVSVETGVKAEPVMTLRVNLGSFIAAAAVERLLTERLEHFVETARREEYEQGWKDAKSHKSTKRTWFAALIDAKWDGANRP